MVRVVPEAVLPYCTTAPAQHRQLQSTLALGKQQVRRTEVHCWAIMQSMADVLQCSSTGKWIHPCLALAWHLPAPLPAVPPALPAAVPLAIAGLHHSPAAWYGAESVPAHDGALPCAVLPATLESADGSVHACCGLLPAAGQPLQLSAEQSKCSCHGAYSGCNQASMCQTLHKMPAQTFCACAWAASCSM